MRDKTSSEIQNIFSLSRDDIKRFEKIGVLTPNKHGKGIASGYSDKDLERLLDAKLLLLSGYRLPDTSIILSENYSSEENIMQQIKKYKRYILILEFLQLNKQDHQRITAYVKKQKHKVINDYKKCFMGNLEPDEYSELFWNVIELVFIVDYLGQVHDSRDSSEIAINKITNAMRIINKIIQFSGRDNEDSDYIETIRDLIEDPIENENEIRDVICECLDELNSHRHEIIETMTNECLGYFAPMDAEFKAIFRDYMIHIYQFCFDFFGDKDVIFNIYTNVKGVLGSIDSNMFDKGMC